MFPFISITSIMPLLLFISLSSSPCCLLYTLLCAPVAAPCLKDHSFFGHCSFPFRVGGYLLNTIEWRGLSSGTTQPAFTLQSASLQRGYSGAGDTGRTGCLQSQNLKAENWRAALLELMASAFPQGRKLGKGVPVPKTPASLLLPLPCSDPFPGTEDEGC